MNILQAENLTYTYNTGTPFETTAIEDVSVSIAENELIGIIGHTGSGKSTLVQHFNGLLRPTNGKVYVEGEDIWADKSKIRSVRFKVGLCFQYPEHQLFEETVYKDIAFGPKNMGLSEKEIDQRVRETAEFVGVKESHLSASPFDLSGGEKRRVAIAGVMAMRPEILILDEPTAGLDPRGRDRILNMVKQYQQETHRTVLLVSHSMEDMAKVADKLLVMNNKRVAMYAPTQEVFSHARELENMGLDVPQVTKIFMGLKNKGILTESNVYTVKYGAKEILQLKGGAVSHD